MEKRIGTLRDAFDRDMDFVTVKPFKLNGAPYNPGQSFDKTLVNTRRLRQMYEQRYLRMVDPAAPVVREERARPIFDFGNNVSDDTPASAGTKPKTKRVKMQAAS